MEDASVTLECFGQSRREDGEKEQSTEGSYYQEAEMKRSAREQCCSIRPQALRCCSAGCGSGRAFRLACGRCQEAFGAIRPEEQIPARTGGVRFSFRRWRQRCGYAALFLPRLSNSQGTAVVNTLNDYSDSDQRPQSSPPLRDAASTNKTQYKSGPIATVVHQNFRLT